MIQYVYMDGLFTYFSISALINAVTSLGLGGYILITNSKKRITRYVAYFCFAVAVWSVPYFFWQIADTASSALFWSRSLMYGAIFTSISFFHMVLVFLEIDKQRFYKFVLVIFYSFSLFWVAITNTSWFIVGVEPRLWFRFWPIPGPLYAIFLLLFAIHVLYASALLFHKYRTSIGIIKKQTFFLMIGIFIAFVGGSTNYFLWYNVPIAPWGNGLVTVYVVLTVYSIMKYGFLNFRVIAVEIFVGVILIIFFVETLFTNSTTEFLLRLIGLSLTALFGVVLVRSVRQEVERREEIAKLASSLERANLRLQELDRQKTEFLSIASHQLRTPLSIIKGYLELISDGAYGKVTKKMKGILGDMDESNERLVKLVDDFLDITRIEQGRTKFSFDTYDMNELVTSVVKELTNRAKDRKLKIVWKASKEKQDIYMDDEKVRHVVFNYIDNAIKYTPKGNITVMLEPDERGLTLRVKDTGIGFGKEDEANFFQKFYRGKNVEGTNDNGTGLGIYVCRKFIETHGGHVWAKSKGTGRGSEFGFWIPYQKGAVAKIMQPSDLEEHETDIAVPKKDTSILASVV